MNKLFAMLVAAVLLMPAAVQAQTYYWRDYNSRHTSYSDLYQDRVRIANDRAELSRSQDILARDRALGRWWRISNDVQRVRNARVLLNADLAAYDAHRAGTPPTTYRHWWYRYE